MQANADQYTIYLPCELNPVSIFSNSQGSDSFLTPVPNHANAGHLKEEVEKFKHDLLLPNPKKGYKVEEEKAEKQKK